MEHGTVREINACESRSTLSASLHLTTSTHIRIVSPVFNFRLIDTAGKSLFEFDNRGGGGGVRSFHLFFYVNHRILRTILNPVTVI